MEFRAATKRSTAGCSASWTAWNRNSARWTCGTKGPSTTVSACSRHFANRLLPCASPIPPGAHRATAWVGSIEADDNQHTDEHGSERSHESTEYSIQRVPDHQPCKTNGEHE